MTDPVPGSAAPETDEPIVCTALCCPMCGWSKSETVHGPTYKPRRWFRRTAFWRCTWCHYEWEDSDAT